MEYTRCPLGCGKLIVTLEQHMQSCPVAFEMQTDVAEFIAIWNGKARLDAVRQSEQ